MRIGIIGTGYVGLVTGACFAEFGVSVTCVDKDSKKIASLKRFKIPFYEPGLEELIKKNTKSGRLSFSTRLADAIDSSQVVFIAVGTPPRGDGSADMKYVQSVAREIAGHIKDYKVIVTKSTVPVGTGRELRAIISRHLRESVDFDIASNPEFLREGAAIEDFMHPNRVVIGTESERAAKILQDLYRPLSLMEVPFVITDIPNAELIKYASNCFLATKISFINEMANLCDALGADIHIVARGMGLDKRIGSKFLHPGPGFGGSCFPKDLKAMIEIARRSGNELKVASAAAEANERQIAIVLKKIKDAIGGFRGKTLAVLGLSFKPNTDDIRNSPALKIIRAVRKAGAVVRAYDPAALRNARAELPGVSYFKDPYRAIKGAHALVIPTEWNEFRNLDLTKVKGLLASPYFFDLRNIYEPGAMAAMGFKYYSVGRPAKALAGGGSGGE